MSEPSEANTKMQVTTTRHHRSSHHPR